MKYRMTKKFDVMNYLSKSWKKKETPQSDSGTPPPTHKSIILSTLRKIPTYWKPSSLSDNKFKILLRLHSLFLIAINDISKCVTFPLTQCLFADDYGISLRSSDPARAHRLLQEVLDIITAWSNNKGFRFSSKKTYMVIFKRNESHSLPWAPVSSKFPNFIS